METLSTLLALCEGNPSITRHVIITRFLLTALQYIALHMMMSLYGNIFHTTGPLWGESTNNQACDYHWIYSDSSSIHCSPHYDVTSWNHFLHYWPVVRGILCWQSVDSPHKWPVIWSFDDFFVFSLEISGDTHLVNSLRLSDTYMPQ